jgi:anti-sigma B factor antagonist
VSARKVCRTGRQGKRRRHLEQEFKEQHRDMSFLIGQEKIEGTSVLRLVGELDVSTVPALREAMERRFAEGADSLALDFSGVTFVDSTGLGALLGAKRRVMERSGQIYLLGTSEPLERLLQMLSLKQLFILVSDPVDLPVVVAEQEREASRAAASAGEAATG